MALRQQLEGRPAPVSCWACGRHPYGDTHAEAAYRYDARVLLAYLWVIGLDMLAIRLLHLGLFARTRLASADATQL